MKTLFLAFLTTIGSWAVASTAMDIENAKVGDLFALKRDVIFPAEVRTKILSSRKVKLNNKEIEIVCGIQRFEFGDACGGFAKVIVRANKYRVISSDSRAGAKVGDHFYVDFQSRPQQKSPKCSAALQFACQIKKETRSDSETRDVYAKKIAFELNDAAAQLISVKPDDSNPGEWP